ncbi:hypothetical protein [Singulisphaera acidiphila]|uniref:hypothetical protein n=1 Tax=Singulisphaera acidiphila TaxID=466153 RepID=UPI00036809A3|nr:hypothetical protein [Singulisphaera acidiphila]
MAEIEALRARDGMLFAQLTYAITLVVSTFFGPLSGPGEGKACVLAALRPAYTQPARDHVAMRTDVLLDTKHASLLDDEIEVPDAPEDRVPDDHGQAFSPDTRGFHLIAFHTITTGGFSVQTPNSSRVHERPSDWHGRQHFLSLCRLRC